MRISARPAGPALVASCLLVAAIMLQGTPLRAQSCTPAELTALRTLMRSNNDAANEALDDLQKELQSCRAAAPALPAPGMRPPPALVAEIEALLARLSQARSRMAP